MKITTTLIAMLLAWPLMGQAAIGSMAAEGSRNATSVKADTTTTATNQKKTTDEKKIFSNPETMPQFPGGTKALAKYLSTKIKYPQEARKAGAQGRVILNFIVGADGSISNVKTLKSVHPALDAEAIRVIKAMPKWTPGRQNGKNVRVKYTIPVNFKMPTGTIVDPQAYKAWKEYMKAQSDSIKAARQQRAANSKKAAKQAAEQK